MNMTMGLDTTIRDYISSYEDEELVSSAFFLKQVFTTNSNTKMLVNFNSLVLKYLPEMQEIKIKITLSNEEYAKYRHNPKYLSNDIYGTTELWFLILEANELHSIRQFDSKTIYLYRTDIVEKMVRILNLETVAKNYNEDQISESLLS